MGTFGLMFYGPYQHWWYSLLNQRWPLKTSSHFLTKVCPCLCNAYTVGVNKLDGNASAVQASLVSLSFSTCAAQDC